MNKTGLFELLYLLIIILVTAIIAILFYALTDKFTTAFDESGVFPEDSTAEKANKAIQSHAPHIADEFVFFLFLFSIIALIIAAAKTNFSPTVIFLFVIVLILAVLIAAGMVDIYQGLAQEDELSEYSTNLTLTNIIFSRFTPLIICVLGFIIVMIMYGKSGGDIVT